MIGDPAFCQKLSVEAWEMRFHYPCAGSQQAMSMVALRRVTALLANGGHLISINDSDILEVVG